MLVPLELPPGIVRQGTEYQSAGRYYDGNLVRWRGRDLQPVGGWRVKSTTAITGVGRELETWRDNSNQVWAGIGTESKLYAMTQSGVLHDITPSGFTAGRADAATGGGYGRGDYGDGEYGVPVSTVTTLNPASVWSLDTWGEYLVGVMPEDGTIYEWQLDTETAAAAVSNAPEARCLLVTEERILMAFGCDGNPRRIEWSDQEDNTDWTPTATNYAGGFNLQTQGTIMCAHNTKGGILIFTDTDVWRAVYQGQPSVYGFPMESDGAGVVSSNAATVIDGNVLWMGPEGFWSYTGYVTPLICDIEDYVFSDINRSQISKVSSFHNSSFNEVWWFYPSANSTENDRYVAFNYRDKNWSKGDMARVSASDISPFTYPIMVSTDGYVYDHEIGTNHQGAMAWVEGGPIELAGGAVSATGLELFPDERTSGQVTTTFLTRAYPNDTQTEHGPYTASQPTSVRFTGRQVNVRYDAAANADFRIGKPRLRVKPRGRR